MFKYKEFDATKMVLCSENADCMKEWACEKELSMEEKAEFINDYNSSYFVLKGFLEKLIAEDKQIRKKAFGYFNCASLKKWMVASGFSFDDKSHFYRGGLFRFEDRGCDGMVLQVRDDFLKPDVRISWNNCYRSLYDFHDVKNFYDGFFSQKGVDEVFHRLLSKLCKNELAHKKALEDASYSAVNSEKIDLGKKAYASMNNTSICFGYGDFKKEEECFRDGYDYLQSENICFNPLRLFADGCFAKNEYGELTFKRYKDGKEVLKVLSKEEAQKAVDVMEHLKKGVLEMLLEADEQLKEVIK